MTFLPGVRYTSRPVARSVKASDILVTEAWKTLSCFNLEGSQTRGVKRPVFTSTVAQ